MSSIWVDLMGVEYKQTYYDAGGYRTRVIEAGSGEPLILLHGTGGHAEAYIRNIESHAKHFHVYAIDMLGHGYTDRPDIDYDIGVFVDHLVSFIDTIGADQVYLSGESLGAMVSSWTCIRYPERVKKVVLNTGILMRPNGAGLQELKDVMERSAKAAGGLTKESVRGRLAWLMADPEQAITDELVDVRYEIYAQPGMAPIMGKIAKSVLGGIIDEDWCKKWVNPELMRDIKCPAQILWTKFNPGQPSSLAKQALEYLPNGEFVELQHSAHWPQWEEPEAFDKVHLEFLLR